MFADSHIINEPYAEPIHKKCQYYAILFRWQLIGCQHVWTYLMQDEPMKNRELTSPFKIKKLVLKLNFNEPAMHFLNMWMDYWFKLILVTQSKITSYGTQISAYYKRAY
jgi:hypothetical protein